MTVKFEDLGLSEELMRAVSDAGYETPTPIQEKAIPYILMNRDVLGCAQTGTGKTASFTLPMIDVLSHGRARARMPRSVILAPTRELAAQVADNFETYGKYQKLTMALLIGGVSFAEQEKKLDRGVDVLVATPGRLLDHCERGKVMLTDTKILVIDEADRMLDMGFVPDVERIVGMTPPLRQTVMFSATMPKEVRRLADKFLSNPKEVTVDKPSSTADTIKQGIAFAGPREKNKILRGWLDDDKVQNGIIFCNRKRDVATLYASLSKRDYPVGALHGDMDQYKRMECLSEFKEGKITLLVCSDVAARGLDIASVSHVFNYDVPNNPEDYVHRVGRTGRAGRDGTAYTIVGPQDNKALRGIEQLIKKSIPVLEGFGKDRQEKKGTGKDAARKDFGKEAGNENVKASRNGAASAKPEAASAKPEKDSPKENRRSRGKRDRSRRYDDDVVIGVEPESNLPFGQTDGVPAFLLRK